MIITCAICGVEFQRCYVTSKAPCCSSVCRNKANRMGLLDQRCDNERPALYRTRYTRWLRTELERRRALGLRDDSELETAT